MSPPASPDERTACAEAERLGREGPSAVGRLVELLSHRSWTVRRAAVAALAGGDAETLKLAARALTEQRSSEPAVAGLVDALSTASAAADPLVSELLTTHDLPVLCDAIQIAGRRGDRRLASRLIELTEHADDNVALAALEALGRIGGADAVERLIALAGSGNFFRAFPAIEVLGRTRDVRAVPVLETLILQPLYAPEAARALGRIGSLLAVPALVKAVQSGPESLLRIGAQSLAAIEDAAEQTIGPALAVSRLVREQAPPELRARVARALLYADEHESIALGRLLLWLANEDSIDDFVRLLPGREEVSVLALQGLTRLGALSDPRVLECLVQGSSELRARLLPAMMGISAAASAVTACLGDELPSVRTLACHALARGRERSAVPLLFSLLLDPDLGVVQAAIGAIQSLGSAETERLAIAAARSSNPAERRAGLRIVTYFGYDGTFELCLEALQSNDERLRDIALAGLPMLEDARVLPVLLAYAKDPAPRTRAAAVRSLGHASATAEATALLQAALDDEDAWVRYFACQSLGRLGVAAAVPAIVRKLSDPAGQVKMAAIEALSAIPGPAAAEQLARLAASDDVEVRRAALVGIGERKEPKLRPALDAALASPDPAIRLVAVSSLARFAETEAALGQVAASDTDAGVRSAALELLAQRPDEETTRILLELLRHDPSSKGVLAALGRELEARIPVLQVRLEEANDGLSRALVGVLARSTLRSARGALDAALVSRNEQARRAAARALSLILDDSARSSLARAASVDSDAEVRRICAAALA